MRMWKNFKIRTKMLVGFGLAFLVFGTSILVTWSYLEGIRKESEFIAYRVIPAQLLCVSISDSANELILTMRDFLADESQESAASARRWIATIQGTMGRISAFYDTAPELESLAHMVNRVFPALRSYFDSIEQSIVATFAKNEIQTEMTAIGYELSAKAIAVEQTLRNHALSRFAGSAVVPKDLMLIISEASGIVIDVEDVRRGFLGALVRGDIAALNQVSDTLSGRLAPRITEFRDSLENAEHAALVNAQFSIVERYQAAKDRFITYLVALDDLTQQRFALRDAVSREIARSIQLTQDSVVSLSGNTLQNLASSITIMITSAILATLFGILVAYLISNTIAKPLTTIAALAKRAGDGDLTIEQKDFHYDSKDELGYVVQAMSVMIASQENTVQRAVDVSDDLTHNASDLIEILNRANASMAAAKASIEQVVALSESNGAALEECNAGIEELSAGADTVAQSATDSAAFISQTTEASNRAINSVNIVINGMHDVEKNAKESEVKTTQLVASVENVSSFVSVITGIADQTNLLALNAAIEAARAGEVGRGFAVVAEEVRKLAEESARAAQSVNGIIVELQRGAHESIKATTEAGRKLVETISQAKQAQTELSSALDEIYKANDSIQNIAAVAEEQAASCKEVASAIDNATKSTMDVVGTVADIRKYTDETATAAQGVATQSEAMSESVDSLTEVLSNFVLKDVPAKDDKSQPKAMKALGGKK